MSEFVPGGITPIFNEVTILLAIAPRRPAPNDGLAEVQKYGIGEKCLMQAPIDKHTGIVQPTLFYRSETFPDPNTGLRTQLLTLVADPPTTISKIFGGELGMNVLPPKGLRDVNLADFTPQALDAAPVGLHPHAAIPVTPSVGRIQALQHSSDFPARVSIPVYYAFVSGGVDGKLETTADNFSMVAREPHSMEAVVNSIPPDPETPVRANEWNLVDDTSPYLKLWVKVEAFRFLSIGDWSHKQRLTYRNGNVVTE